VKGQAYTREQIHDALGGSRREALPTSGGKVVCACLTRRMNPRAPEEIVIGGSDGAVRLARAFAASGAAVPVFVRAARGGWEYAGERRVRTLIEEPGALLALVAEGAPPDASLALLLEEAAGTAAEPVAAALPASATACGGTMVTPAAPGNEG
jgi:hypothetical protein